MTDLLYFDDFSVGQTFDLRPYRVTKEEIVEFAAKYDPQPFHLDEDAGAKSFLGGLCASGWQTGAITHRLNCEAFFLKVHSLGGMGSDDMRWQKPVFPGDEISGKTTIIEMRPSGSRPTIGLVHLQTDVFNQKAEPVFTMKAWCILARRPAS
jgi:acyl dehydratase